MLKDVTLGQYFPGNTVTHRLDPRTKILLLILLIVAIFLADGWVGNGLMIAVTAACMIVSRIKPRSIFKGLKPMLIIIVFTSVLNLFYTEGTPIFPGRIICAPRAAPSQVMGQPGRTGVPSV